jgi:transcriptional regulator with XRE-family HTH domain
MSGIPSSMDADMVRSRIRDKIEAMGITQSAYAEMCGYSQAYLSDFLNGLRGPGPAILKAEGLKAVTYYEFDED